MKTIDTRDLYKRKCELEDLRDAVTMAKEELEEAQEAHDSCDPDAMDEEKEELAQAVTDAEAVVDSALSDFGTDEAEELAALEELESEITDFMHGATMILERDFESYAEELAEDITPGFSSTNQVWPFTCIDWGQAAKELAMDYTSVEYQGDTYLVRA